MPRKSKHGRGKHHKRGKFRQMRAVAGSQPQTAGSVAQPSAPAGTTPVPKSPTPKAAAPSAALPAHYEYVSGDLKRIAILACIIFTILIVLYFILT